MSQTALHSRDVSLNARLKNVLALHFHPQEGSPYWLEQAARLGFDPRDEIDCVAVLGRLGPMDGAALAQRPVEDFIPRSLLNRRKEFLMAETGGTLGRPKFAVHRADEFASAFVAPFVAAARRVHFPLGLNWLFVGPTGPHIIGKAARACATALQSPDPFNVDFDPRWARKLADQSFARDRYLKHIEAQALNVLNVQEIGVIFSTSPVLASIGAQIPPARRQKVRGIHFGGMAVSDELRARLGELFPQAIMLSGYGNTLFGVAPELHFQPAQGIDYFPHGHRLIYQIVRPNAWADRQRIPETVDYGERGQVVAHRLDETQLIVNMYERDTAIRIAPPPEAAADGFCLDGLRDPQPLVDSVIKPALGLY